MYRFIVLVVVMVASLLVTAPGVGAAPIDPFNIRPIPVTIPSQDGPGTDLQAILDQVFPGAGLDAVDDQSPAGLWSVVSPLFPSTTPTIVFEYAGLASSNMFGIWSGTDTSSISSVSVFNGNATSGTRAALSWATPGGGDLTITQLSGPAGAVNATTVSGIDPFSFGFFLSRAGGPSFYTADALNYGGTAQVLAYERAPGSDTWMLAFEDLWNTPGTSDQDFNDLIVRVDSIQAVTPVPLPPAVLLFGSGLVGLGAAVRRRRAGRGGDAPCPHGL